MRQALRSHLRDMIAVSVMVAVGFGVAAYILSNQRLRFPLLEEKPVPMWVELPNAQGVTPGQGQTVRVSGMRVGDIGKVELQGGRARVRMDLEPEYEDLVRRDATVLLRPRTGLKDMFLALDPGTRSQPKLGRDGVVRIDNTAPDVNADEILSALDTDTRDYLKLLINGAGKGLKGRGGDLREVFRRLGPLHRDLAALNGEVVKRRRNLARLVHNYGSTVDRLGREDDELASLVSGANRGVRPPEQRGPEHLRGRAPAAGNAGPDREHAAPRARAGAGGGPRVRGAAPRRAPDRRHQPPAPPAGQDGRARAAQAGAPVRARRAALRGPGATGRHQPGQGQPRPARVVLRAQPVLQHGRVQPGRPPEADR